MSASVPWRIGPAKLLLSLVYLALWPAVLFALARDVRWVEGWIFMGWFLALCLTTMIWLYRKDPALLAERYRAPGTGGQQGWDRWVVYAITLGFIAWIVLMPLDARRHRWLPLPGWTTAAGAALLAVAFFFFFRAFTDNTFLSPLVRVQSERRQRVVSTGVYAIVRHPMYLGASLMFLGGPLVVRSGASLIAGAALVALLAGRIVGEEKLLNEQLEGYDAYRRQVRYRLLPFVW